MQINFGDAFGGNFAFEAQGQLTTWAEDEARAWKSVPWLAPEQATMFADRLEKFAIAMKPYFGAQSPIKLRRVRALLAIENLLRHSSGISTLSFDSKYLHLLRLFGNC